jgi:hypothetical protein
MHAASAAAIAQVVFLLGRARAAEQSDLVLMVDLLSDPDSKLYLA